MVSDASRGKSEVDDKNLRKTLSNGKEMEKCNSEKEKNVMQVLVESEKAEFHLEMGRKSKRMTARSYRAQFRVQRVKTVFSGEFVSALMGRKSKRMTARSYKAQFRVQRVKTVFSDSDEAIEGPDAVVIDKVVDGPPDSVDSENSTPLPRSRDGIVHSETVDECRDRKDINGVMVRSERVSPAVMDNVVGQPADGNCSEETCVNKLHTNSSSVKRLNSLQKASTWLARSQDGFISESDVKCMRPGEITLFPESVNDIRPAICKNACLKRKGMYCKQGPRPAVLVHLQGLYDKRIELVFANKKRVKYSNESPHEPNTDNTDVENKRRKLVKENVDPESVQDGHQVTQVANCVRGPSITASRDKSQSSIISKQDVNRGPFNGRGAEAVSPEVPNVEKEVGEEYGRSKIDSMTLELTRKCLKREMKLQRKQQEKIHKFHKIWDEKREQLDKDNGLEVAFIRSVFSEGPVRTARLKRLNEGFLLKIENLKRMKDVELKRLEEEQSAAMNEEKQKASRWLSTARLNEC